MEAPHFYQNISLCPQFMPQKLHSSDDNNNNNKQPNGVDPFVVEDLLDFSNDDANITADTVFYSTLTGNSTDSSNVNVVDTCNSSSLCGSETTNFVGDIGCRNIADNHFSNDFCVPYDDLAELEWLSNSVEESFSSEDLQKLQLISGMKARTTTVDEDSKTRQFQPEQNRNGPVFYSDVSVPAKARSKRSRPAPCNWTSRLLLVPPTTITATTTTTTETTSSSELDIVVSAPSLLFPQPCTAKKTVKNVSKKKEVSEEGSGSSEGRKCLHCATDKTPQWRTGPVGPKTLCNACGVRYKSGRLVPEYRPAASPTFVLTKHSNSHRKVLELRRQKEMLNERQQQQFLRHQNIVFDVSSNGDDYLIHQHVGPDFRQLI